MRYFLTGLSLFVLMAVFVRVWYMDTQKMPKSVVTKGPIAQLDEVYKTPESIFSGTIILEDNLLLNPSDYQEVEKVVKILRNNPKSKLDILSPNLEKVNNTLRTILTDQGILETRFQFLRKQSKSTDPFKILLQVK